MKKKLLVSITTLVTSISLLLCLLALTAPAAQSEPEISSPTIISKNISYESEVFTYYAVPISSVADGASVELVFYKADGVTESYRVGWSRTETVQGIPCYVFRNNGTAPKDINKTEIVRAVTSDGAQSDPVTYSVLEYLCEKLFHEGYAAKSPLDGDDDVRRRLYFQLIRYSMSAQQLFNPKGDPIDDFNYLGIYRTDVSGFRPDGDKVVLDLSSVVAPEYKEAVYFTLYRYDIDGNQLESRVCIDGELVSTDGLTLLVPGFVNHAPDDKTVIFEDSEVAIVGSSTDGAAELISDAVTNGLTSGRVENASAVDTSRWDVHIIIGMSDDAVSKRAYEKLDEIRSDKMFSESKYVIYAEDGKIAVAYDENIYTDIQPSRFAALDLVSELVFENGRAEMYDGQTIIGEVDLIAEQEKLDVVEEEGYWQTLLAAAISKYGEEGGAAIVDALRTYYSVRSDGLITWYANLYDPGIGGFYASATGKLYDGFLPPIETTGQLLGHLVSLNLMSSKKAGLPHQITAQVVYYIKSCQSSNGYFYNPQMTKADTDNALVRRGRDLSRCTSLLADFGVKPTYNTPAGVAGDGKTADQWWDEQIASGFISADTPKPYVPTSLEDYREHLTSPTESIAIDTASAVSLMMERSGVVLASAEVIADDVVLDDYVSTPQKFAAYLAALNIDANPYSIGNEINGTYKIIANASQYVAPDEATTEWYKGLTLKEMLITWFTDHVDPDTGLFGTSWRTDRDDSTKGVEFLNTNGFFKIITVYNAWGYAYPEPAKAAAGLIAGISGDEKSLTNICNVYNAWNALGSLKDNVNKYVTDEDEKADTLTLISNTFSTGAADAILKSYDKQKNYLCSDGTFSNTVSGSASSYPGGLAVSFGAKEGNVDAIGFGFHSIVDAMYSVLGLSGSKVRYYYDHSYLLFIETILNVEPVTEKRGSGVNDKNYITTFEDKTLGELYRITSPSISGLERDPEIVEEQNGNHALEITKDNFGDGTAVTVKQYVTYKEASADTLVFSGRINVTELKKHLELQFTVGPSSGTSPIVFVFKTSAYAKDESGKFIYDDAGNPVIDPKAPITLAMNGKGVSIPSITLGAWFDFRVEYRVTATDEEGAPTAFESMAFINGKYVGTVTQKYSAKAKIYDLSELETATLSLNNSTSGAMRVDDLKLQAVKAKDSITVESGNQYSAVSTDGTVAHTFVKGSGTTGPVIAVKPTYNATEATKLVWGAKIKASSLSARMELQLTAMTVSSSPFVAVLSTKTAADGSYVYAYSTSSEKYCSTAKVGEWFDYRVEYSCYTDESGATVYLFEQYINDKLIYSTSVPRSGDYVKPYAPNDINRISFSINQKNAGTYEIYGIYSYTE